MFTVCEFCKSPRAGLPTLKIDSSSYMVLLISSSINFTMGLDPVSWRVIIFNIMNFCYQNCSSDLEKLLKFEAEGREFAKFLTSLEQFIQTVKGENNFW